MAYIIKPDEETAKIFSDKTRLKIVELLSEKELTNSQLARMLNLSKPTISHHLKILLYAGIVKISRIMEQISKEIQEVMRLRSSTSDSHANNAFLRMLKSTVLDTGIDMDKPFYYAGYNTGVNVISKEVKANTLKDVLKEFAQMWEELKLGTVELMGENKIQVKDCYQCGNMPNIGKLLCSSDIETKCWGTGYDLCEFEIKEL